MKLIISMPDLLYFDAPSTSDLTQECTVADVDPDPWFLEGPHPEHQSGRGRARATPCKSPHPNPNHKNKHNPDAANATAADKASASVPMPVARPRPQNARDMRAELQAFKSSRRPGGPASSKHRDPLGNNNTTGNRQAPSSAASQRSQRSKGEGLSALQERINKHNSMLPKPTHTFEPRHSSMRGIKAW